MLKTRKKLLQSRVRNTDWFPMIKVRVMPTQSLKISIKQLKIKMPQF